MANGKIYSDLENAMNQVKEFAKTNKCPAIIRKIEYASGYEFQVDRANEFDLKCYASGSEHILMIYSHVTNSIVKRNEIF